MLRPHLAWWRKLLESHDAKQRWTLIDSAARARFQTTDPKKEQKIRREIWDLASSVAEIERPIDAFEALERGLIRIAKETEVELLPREEEIGRFLASKDADVERAAGERRVAEEKLLRWLAAEEEAPLGERTDLEIVLRPKQDGDSLPLLAFELRAGEPGGASQEAGSGPGQEAKAELRPQSIEAIGALLQDVRAKRKLVSPAQRRLLEWILSRGSMPGQTGHVVALRNVTEWIALFGGDELIRWEDGEPVTLDLQPARLSLARETPDGPATWVLAPSSLPLGSAPILRELEGASGEPQLWVRLDRTLRPLDALGMPVDLFALLVRSPEVPIEKLKDSAIGALLAKRLVKDRGTSLSRDLVETVPVRPEVDLRIENEMTYSVSVRARAADGTEFVRAHGGAWVPLGSLAPSRGASDHTPSQRPGASMERIGEADGAPLPERAPRRAAMSVIPRSDDVAKVDAWITRLVPREAERTVLEDGSAVFSWRADGSATLRLVRLWLARPSGVDYFGDGSFKSVVKIHDEPRLKVSTRETDAGIDWLEVSVELEDELASLSLGDIAEALEQSDRDVLMLRGARLYRREHLKRYLEEARALLDAGVAAGGGWQRVHAKALAGSAVSVLAKGGAKGRIQEVIERRARADSSPHPIPDAPVDPHALSFLRPYQRSGANFLTYASHTFGGALLADDMGLGKTLQTLSAISALRALSATKGLPALVICPASVAHNWKREAQKFVPDLKTVVIEGGEKRRRILDRLSDYDLVIENFALVRRDVETLAKKEFLAVVIDEAQAIKNPGAEITHATKQLRARHRIALTGTPIENRLTDLWSIIDYAVPGYLGSLSSFERMAKDQDADVLHKMLGAKIRPLIMRRLKREVAPELPDRIEERLDCEMSEAQKNVYLAEVKRTRILLEGVTDPSAMTGEKRVRMLAALTRLRLICCEPSMVDLPGRGSGKVDELLELIPELLASGHKVLVFSQFVKMLEIIEARFGERGIPFRTLTGQTQDRMKVVDEFEKDPTPSVFLISLKAGGTGLNLVSASHVVLFDPWWSPALEAQAIDRSHRIGQEKTVVAIRMVAKGTIEERILELQERKRDLSRDVLGEATIDRALTPADLDFLLADVED